MFTKIVTFEIYLEFVDQLLLPYKFSGSSTRGILFSNLGSCDPLSVYISIIAFNCIVKCITAKVPGVPKVQDTF